jgi:hypothetical protein
MVCRLQEAGSRLRRFGAEEDGVATIDWIMICLAATAAGILVLDISQERLGRYNADVRTELQGQYFQTSWTQQLAIPPEEYWDQQEPIIPGSTGTGTGSGNAGNGNGNGNANGNDNGNNGHGNDDDGCDASNPGNNPNCAGDTSDDDGTPGNSNDPGDDDNSNGNANGGNSGGGGTSPGPAVVMASTPITVTNASFETTGHSPGFWSPGVPGWSINTSWGADVGDFNPGPFGIDTSTVSGNNVAFLYSDGGNNSAAMWQTFSETYTAGHTYEFAVDVGDGSYSFSGNVPYQLNIFAGNTLIGSTSGWTGNIDALTTATVTSDVDNAALNGQPITFQIVQPPGPGGDLLVDNVRGTVTAPTSAPSTGISPVPVAELQPIPPNATVIDLGTKQISAGYGDNVYSDWINAAQLGIPMPAEFVMYGAGNPTGLTSSGSREPSGVIQWGAQIMVDVPPCGGSREVQMFLNGGEVVLTFAVVRPEWPSNWGPPPANCG